MRSSRRAGEARIAHGRRRVGLALTLLVACATTLPASAGGFTHSRSTGPTRGASAATQQGQGFWNIAVRAAAAAMLDPDGDEPGDLTPVIGESSVFPYLPWAVWSRPNQGEYDLVWTRWLDGKWAPVQWLSYPDLMGDDLDADLAFDANGRAHVVWWREEEGGVGRIYFSMFCQTQWMDPLAVSLEDRDGRYPRIVSVDGGVTVTVYETPTGPVEQTITFSSGTGITDDIDPLDVMHVDAPVHIEQNP